MHFCSNCGKAAMVRSTIFLRNHDLMQKCIFASGIMLFTLKMWENCDAFKGRKGTMCPTGDCGCAEHFAPLYAKRHFCIKCIFATPCFALSILLRKIKAKHLLQKLFILGDSTLWLLQKNLTYLILFYEQN